MLILSFLIFTIFSFVLLHEELSILQTQFYELKRYFLYKKERDKKKIKSFVLISLILMNLVLFIYLRYKFLIIIIPFLLFILCFQKRKERIIKLSITSRIKRLIIIYFLVLLISGFPFIYIAESYSYIYLFCYETIVYLLFKLVVSFVVILDYPLEKQIINKYKNLAIKKLKKINPILIGVTGSYGKTSTKNYLYELLSLKYRVCKTPKSYNTLVGILKSINEEMNENCEIMIIELGVDKVDGLNKVLSFLEFDYSIITSIGPQHLKTFITIDNILKEKSKILNKTKKCIFLNYNNEHLRTLDLSKYCKTLTYSFYNDTNLIASNIKLQEDQMTFKLKYDREELELNTNVLGRHQLENLIGSILIAFYLGVDLKKIKRKVRYLNNERHRMEIKYLDNLKIIDDSYNSNVNGFKNALDVLEVQSRYKVLITPGVIELGQDWEKKNRELGSYASSKTDFVVLVGKSVTRPFYLGLVNKGFNESNILVVDTFQEGMEYIRGLDKEVVLLIENDLPDFYLK